MVRITNKNVTVKVDNMTWEVIQETQSGVSGKVAGYSSAYEFSGTPTGGKKSEKYWATVFSSEHEGGMWVFVMAGV